MSLHLCLRSLSPYPLTLPLHETSICISWDSGCPCKYSETWEAFANINSLRNFYHLVKLSCTAPVLKGETNTYLEVHSFRDKVSARGSCSPVHNTARCTPMGRGGMQTPLLWPLLGRQKPFSWVNERGEFHIKH